VTDNILSIAELSIRPGRLEAFKALVKELVQATQARELGTLNYEYFISDDGTTCHIYERYADSAAVMAHMANFAPFGERWAAAVEITHVTAYGAPSAEVKALLGSFDSTLMAPLDGFAR
jgi:quinol monooxygenase YgiN